MFKMRSIYRLNWTGDGCKKKTFCIFILVIFHAQAHRRFIIEIKAAIIDIFHNNNETLRLCSDLRGFTTIFCSLFSQQVVQIKQANTWFDLVTPKRQTGAFSNLCFAKFTHHC